MTIPMYMSVHLFHGKHTHTYIVRWPIASLSLFFSYCVGRHVCLDWGLKTRPCTCTIFHVQWFPLDHTMWPFDRIRRIDCGHYVQECKNIAPFEFKHWANEQEKQESFVHISNNNNNNDMVRAGKGVTSSRHNESGQVSVQCTHWHNVIRVQVSMASSQREHVSLSPIVVYNSIRVYTQWPIDQDIVQFVRLMASLLSLSLSLPLLTLFNEHHFHTVKTNSHSLIM